MSQRYQRIGPLGRGGFGRIELFYDTQVEQRVIRKSLINPTYENCQRLIREGEICIELRHEVHIIDLLDYYFDYSNPWLIFPYYEAGVVLY